MAIPTRKTRPCSPTSALEKNRLNVERGAEESFLIDNDKLIYAYGGETSGSFICPRLSYIIRKPGDIAVEPDV